MESQAGQPARDSTGVITTISGQPVKHRDVDRLARIQATIAACVPADYGDMLALLTYTVACGHGYQLADFVRRTAQQFAAARQR